MKSRKRKILSVMLALIVLAGCLTPSVEVKAMEFTMYNSIAMIPYQKSITISQGETVLIKMPRTNESYRISNKKKIISSPFVISDGPAIHGSKKGSTTLTIKAKKNGRWKNYPIKVKVVAYKNPVKSLKIGSQTLTSRFKKRADSVRYSPKAKSEKISIKPASGWKVKSITYNYNQKIKNNQKITYDDFTNYIEIALYKEKTKQVEILYLYCQGSDIPWSNKTE